MIILIVQVTVVESDKVLPEWFTITVIVGSDNMVAAMCVKHRRQEQWRLMCTVLHKGATCCLAASAVELRWCCDASRL